MSCFCAGTNVLNEKLLFCLRVVSCDVCYLMIPDSGVRGKFLSFLSSLSEDGEGESW